MRRRDIAFACLAWGGLLAGLAWALSTQSRWVQESARPAPGTRPPPAGEAEPSGPAPSAATGVLGTVSDDTRAALAKGLRPPPARAEPRLAPAPRR